MAPAPGSPSRGGEAPGPGPAAEAPGEHSDPSAIDVVVNKRRPLNPPDFAPASLVPPGVALGPSAGSALLRPDAAAAVERMFADAQSDGVNLTVLSAYRSYANQESTYAYWVNQYGDAALADTVSARPGHSEHQTGLAVDVGQDDGACTLATCFSDTAAGQWTEANAAAYGFIVRYPQGFDGITGFSWEPWHLRYVGSEVARAIEASGTATLEQHFGLPAAPGY
ncbi:M15 family metallopeptidase [Arthrobacter sp. H41]|uniref:M15 family metallopeptidase n=1 Tax=Arthrobacter sp. H41 TaxID=1312978 RepID=UPI0004BCB54A|nr:M15 family metallopeptidase [Arthrobacter sp. H41]